MRGGRQTKDCSQTWSFGFQFRLGKYFSDERGLPSAFGGARVVFPHPGSSWFWEAWKRHSYRPLPGTLACESPRLCGVDNRVWLTSTRTYIVFAVPFRVQIQPIPLGVTFLKVQSSKLERLFCHVSVKRDVRALSFQLWNSIRKCHPKWDWLYILGSGEGMGAERPRKKEKRFLNCMPSKSRPRRSILLLLVFNSVQL